MLEWFKLKKEDAKVMKWLICGSLLYVLPLIISNVYFNDDVARSIYGYYGWEFNGRPLTTLLMKVIGGGRATSIVDGSPSYLILGLIVLSYSFVLFARKHLSAFSTLSKTIIMLFALLSPFLLENLSFKYDVLSMLLALSLIFLIYSFDHHMTRILQMIVGALIVCAVFSLYQAVICAFIILAIFECIEGLLKNKKLKNIFAKVLERILTLGIGALLYEIIINFVIKLDAYSRDHSGLVSFNKQGFAQFINNAKDYKTLVKSLFPYYTYVFIAVGIVCLCAFVMVIYKKVIMNDITFSRKIINIIGVILCVILMIPVGFLPVVALKYPVVCARTLIGMTAMAMMVGMALCYLGRFHKWLHIITVYMLIFSFTFSASYANTLRAQKDYEGEIAQMVAYDLSSLSSSKKISSIAVTGNAPESKQYQRMNKQCPLISRVILIYLNNSWIAQRYIMHYYQENATRAYVTKDDLAYMKHARLDVDNGRYSISIHNQKAIITFK